MNWASVRTVDNRIIDIQTDPALLSVPPDASLVQITNDRSAIGWTYDSGTQSGIAPTYKAPATARTVADARKDIPDSEGVVLRALVLILLDELNTLRSWTRDFMTQTAAATSLADFKARVATLPTLNDRTLAQAKTAFHTKITNGDAD